MQIFQVGRITAFSAQSASGVIQVEQGSCVDFDVTSVLAYDVARLATGQLVSFELAAGTPHRAINVSIQAPASPHHRQVRRREVERVRYLGFEQNGGVRAFRFLQVSAEGQEQVYTVDVDLGLLKAQGLAFQQVPALCLQLLTVVLEPGPAAGLHFDLTSVAGKPALQASQPSGVGRNG